GQAPSLHGQGRPSQERETPMEKGAEVIRTLFLLYFYYINSSGPFGQHFQLYFPSPIIGLSKKTSKPGVDRIFQNGERNGTADSSADGASPASTPAQLSSASPETVFACACRSIALPACLGGRR